jgi:AbrB family looped-hinge helix DNA binding protein
MSADDDFEGETTRITRKGQVTIPKALREAFDLEEGDELVWEAAEDGIRIRKATASTGRGLLVDDDTSEAERERIADEMAAEIRERRRSEWR